MDRSSSNSAKAAERSRRLIACLLRKWQPKPSWQTTILLFLILGLIIIAIGVLFIVHNASIKEYSQQYDVACSEQQNCTVQINVQEKMQAPVFLYYALDNFYQNHRRYIQSKSDSQLAGKYLNPNQISEVCSPIVYNSDLGPNRLKALDGVTVLDPNGPAYPCGLVAYSVFNDTFNMSAPNFTTIFLNETGISWHTDLGKKYKNGLNASTTQWINIEDEHFMVWMRTAGLPTFRRLWARIDGDLDVGTYNISIVNNYDVSKFGGQKYVILSMAGPFGGKNSFVAISYIVVGCVCLLVSLIFFHKYKQVGKRFKAL